MNVKTRFKINPFFILLYFVLLFVVAATVGRAVLCCQLTGLLLTILYPQGVRVSHYRHSWFSTNDVRPISSTFSPLSHPYPQRASSVSGLTDAKCVKAREERKIIQFTVMWPVSPQIREVSRGVIRSFFQTKLKDQIREELKMCGCYCSLHTRKQIVVPEERPCWY